MTLKVKHYKELTLDELHDIYRYRVSVFVVEQICPYQEVDDNDKVSCICGWITDSIGIPIQHLQYLPYGEPYVDQRHAGSTYSERFTFTGKERDAETGYGYFGARYMDHEIMTSFLSVDRYADKYPSISPYAYCAWNPVKLMDPDGRELYFLTGDGRRITYSANMQPVGDEASCQQIAVLNEIYRTRLGRTLITSLKKSSKEFWISNEETGTRQTCATIAYKNGSMSKMGGNNNIRDLSHELFHALQFKAGQGGTTYHNEVEAFTFSKALISEYSKLTNPKDFPSSMAALLSRHPNTENGRLYENAMSQLQGKTFDQKSFNTAVKLFKTESGANDTGVYNTNYTIRTGKEKPLLELFYPLK